MKSVLVQRTGADQMPPSTAAASFGDVLEALDASDDDDLFPARGKEKKSQTPAARDASAIVAGRTHNLPAATFSPEAAKVNDPFYDGGAHTSSPSANSLPPPNPFHDIARIQGNDSQPAPRDVTVVKRPGKSFGIACYDTGKVANIAPGGLAAEVGLKIGDKLLSVNGVGVASAKLLNSLLGKVADGGSVRFTWQTE